VVLSDVEGRVEGRADSSGSGVGDGEAERDGDFVGCCLGEGLRSVRVRSGGVVYLSDGFAVSLTGSDSRGFFDGVEGVARPSQRLDRLEGGVVVGVGARVAEAGFGR
jgi:hypothetical protein